MTAGIYIHIPFCKSRCSYCDFATDVFRDNDTTDRYVDALVSELNSFSQTGTAAETIYFGGGTPSLLSPAQLEKILAGLRTAFSITDDAEFTLEMNPATVTPEKLRAFRSLGVNRASFGVQTFDERSLKILARGHDVSDVRNTFEQLRGAGFENISFDLIAGLPGQTLKDWSRNLDEAIALDPEHLSLYILEVHEGTPLAEQICSGRQPVPDDDLAGEMYQLMQERLECAGFQQYEISNFSKPGFESKHNNKYWKMEPVFGFGVSAHSFDGISRRWSNVRDTNAFVTRIETTNDAIANDETLDVKQLSSEFAFLNLRLRNGLSLKKYRSRFGKDLLTEYRDELSRLENLNFIAISEDSIVLTERGMLFSNEVFEVFV